MEQASLLLLGHICGWLAELQSLPCSHPLLRQCVFLRGQHWLAGPVHGRGPPGDCLPCWWHHEAWGAHVGVLGFPEARARGRGWCPFSTKGAGWTGNGDFSVGFSSALLHPRSPALQPGPFTSSISSSLLTQARLQALTPRRTSRP